MPQEFGNKTDVRWLELKNEQGAGLHVQAEDLMEASVSHIEPKELFRALHTHDIERIEPVILNLDHGQTGLGGASCGPVTLEEHRMKEESYEFSFTLTPLVPEA